MPQRKGLLAPQNTFLDTIATRFDGTHSNFVLGNAQVHDYPIVYCSDGFVELTGYNRSQIMSKCCSCSFLWGERTDENAKQSILNTLEKKSELQIEIQFHKKTSEPFLCLLDIVPIKNDKSQVVLFLVSHKELSPDRHGRSKANCSIPESSLKVPYMLSAQHLTGTSPSNKTPNLLTMGLATTITAAVLGSTGFRSNKLLDYLSARKNTTTPPPTNTTTNAITHNKLDRNTSIINRKLPDRSSVDSNKSLSRYSSTSNNSIISSVINSPRQNNLLDPIDVESGPLLVSEYKSNNNNNNSSKLLTPSRLIVHESESTDTSTDESSNLTSDPSTVYKFQRRRSRAVLYHLSGRFDQKSKHKLPFKKFQRISGKETIPEYKVQDVQASKFILLHYSLFKIIWDWMILLCTFYIAIMVPYNAAFSQGGDEKDLIICDIIVELLFIIDIILNFWTTYVSKSGQVVYHLKAIAINYLRGWFFLDLLAAIPFDVILAVNNPEIQGTIGEMGNWIHLLKLARLLRLARLFQKIERYSQYSTVILGLLMCMFFLVAHWFACGWYCIGKEEFKSKITREYSWLYELGERMQLNRSYLTVNKTNGLTRRALYVSSLYFTTTSLTSVGFGNVSPNTINEKIFAVITMLIGALMHAAVFGNVTTLIQRMYSRRSAYQTKNQDLKDFTRAHHIPKPLKQRMLEFFQAMWAINRGIDKEAILQSFPENLRGDIALHLNREILSLSLFKSASPGCRKCLAQLITTRFATPGEYLVNQGDALRFIYFVCSGSLEILGEEGTVVGLLGKCDIFGSDMDDLPILGFSAYNVKSLTYCELQCIALDHQLQEIFEQYPQFRKQFALSISEELSFNLKAGFDPNSSLELIPAITVITDKNINFNDHSNDNNIKSNEIINEECSLLNDSHNKTIINNKDNQINHENNQQSIINTINTNNNNNNLKINNQFDNQFNNNHNHHNQSIKIFENLNFPPKNQFHKFKQNSLDLYSNYLKKSNESPIFSMISNEYNNEIDQLNNNPSIEQLNNNNNKTNTTNNTTNTTINNNNNKVYKRRFDLNYPLMNLSNSLENFIDSSKMKMSTLDIKYKCKSLDDINQHNGKSFGIYSRNEWIYNTGNYCQDESCNRINDISINLCHGNNTTTTTPTTTTTTTNNNNNNNNNSNDNNDRLTKQNQLISTLFTNFHQTQNEITIIKSELLKINEKLDKIQKNFTEFTKFFIKNENNELTNLYTTNNSNMSSINNNHEKRLKTIYSVTENDTTSSTQMDTTHTTTTTTTTPTPTTTNNNNNSSNSSVKNLKDDLPTHKSMKPSTLNNSRPCLHQYNRTHHHHHHYSPENRVVTFQLPPRNYDFRSQSLTSSRQISPETPKLNPIKKLLHKHPSISHDLN
uniref:Voltage-gated inwardly rectifying potassium channel KCNH3 n=1 Tax=Schistosoma mansoni TaxID=6183 RepID=A0A5K4FAZ0_SCHMA